ncbi:hypothetical protein STEG23_019464, partial [Scotinomys teguina]
MTQRLTCLPCKCEKLNSNIQNSCKAEESLIHGFSKTKTFGISAEREGAEDLFAEDK